MPETLSQAWPKAKKYIADLTTAHNALKTAHAAQTTQVAAVEKQLAAAQVEISALKAQLAAAVVDAPALADLNAFNATNPSIPTP